MYKLHVKSNMKIHTVGHTVWLLQVLEISLQEGKQYLCFFSSSLLTCKAGLSANRGLLFTIWAAIFGSAAKACNIDCVYGAESIFCISCGFSIICCMRLCIPGELRSPDRRVPALLPPVPPVSPPAADQGFGRGSRFSCPCCGFVPSEKSLLIHYPGSANCS